MQSEPTAVSQQHTSLDSSPAVPLDAIQHGHDLRDQLDSGQLPPGHAGDRSRSVDVADASSLVYSGEDEGSPLRRLSSNWSAQLSPAVDRVSQYENALTPSPRKQSEIGFKVVASPNKPRLSIEDFPNGTSCS